MFELARKIFSRLPAVHHPALIYQIEILDVSGGCCVVCGDISFVRVLITHPGGKLTNTADFCRHHFDNHMTFYGGLVEQERAALGEVKSA